MRLQYAGVNNGWFAQMVAKVTLSILCTALISLAMRSTASPCIRKASNNPWMVISSTILRCCKIVDGRRTNHGTAHAVGGGAELRVVDRVGSLSGLYVTELPPSSARTHTARTPSAHHTHRARNALLFRRSVHGTCAPCVTLAYASAHLPA